MQCVYILNKDFTEKIKIFICAYMCMTFQWKLCLVSDWGLQLM
jgi:hypothetical protein